MAETFLAENGYVIMERNYRTRFGEIDIIAKDGITLVFVEVKARRSERKGIAACAVTKNKQRKIIITALFYLKANSLYGCKSRFDVVAIDGAGKFMKFRLIKNAFEFQE